PPPEHFLYQGKADCYYTNGTQRVRYVSRDIWDRRQDVHFDSDVGVWVADTELGEPDAKYWNKVELELRRGVVDMVCRHNYGVLENFINTHKGEFCRYNYGVFERGHVIGGSGGFVLGLIFLALGLLVYLRNKKGEALAAGGADSFCSAQCNVDPQPCRCERPASVSCSGLTITLDNQGGMWNRGRIVSPTPDPGRKCPASL
ncbi:uncharacterized protein LOC102380075, partial [Alligator sinensis]|uniref:Uncharacterized protein LOC102380075 n=2 Tax=Alligator sinensis TaxID=38654 RepID=A0A3Q0FVS1_ALLSI